MADEDDNVESKPSSLGMISDFFSSFTSVESSDSAAEDTESNEVQQTDSQQETSTDTTDTETNTTDVESGGSTDDDVFVERRQSSLERITDFLSSFTSSGSSDDSESKTADEDTSDSAQQIQESSDSADQITSEADTSDIAEDSSFEEQSQSSLGKISDFLSSFTSLGTSSTETTVDNNNQTDEDNTSKAQQENENVENEDVILIDDDSEGTTSEGRLRSSSSRIFTEPESIDSKDLDYVTLVSS